MSDSVTHSESSGFAAVLFSVGVLLNVLAAAMLFPAAIDFLQGYGNARPFMISAALTGFTGILLVLGNRRHRIRLTRRSAFVLTTVSCRERV